jgi:hypothetical protein
MNQLLRRVTDRISHVAALRARLAVSRASRQLTEAMQVIRDSDDLVRLHIAHYWAIYLHDGRGSMGPKKAKFLVYFNNPHEDPRLPGARYPRRAAQVRRLTKQQFYFWLEQNRLARERGTRPPMIIVKRVGPAKGKHFFGNRPGEGMFGTLGFAREDANRIVQEEMRKEIGEEFFRVRTERIVVRV